jgi:hypothetical protein
MVVLFAGDVGSTQVCDHLQEEVARIVHEEAVGVERTNVDERVDLLGSRLSCDLPERIEWDLFRSAAWFSRSGGSFGPEPHRT